MNTSSRVVDALELARNRLHEPAVRQAYDQLVALVDQQLGEKLIESSRAGVLTEPQLVFIEYGLRHLQGAGAIAMGRAADALVAALSGESAPTSPPAATQAAPVQPSPAPEAAPQPQTPLIQRLVQKVGRVTGGSVTINGVQTNHYHAAPDSPDARDEVEVDEEDTGELRVPANEAEIIESDIFISYCHRDGARMRRLREDLRSHGLRVWTDENLQPGTPSWKNAVEGAVRGARVLIVLMTQDSKKSPWVESEINTALMQNIPIFPVLCKGDTKNAVPFALNGYQFVDMRKEADYRSAMLRLVKAIKAKVKPTR